MNKDNAKSFEGRKIVNGSTLHDFAVEVATRETMDLLERNRDEIEQEDKND